MLEDELRAILRGLAAQVGAQAAAIVRADGGTAHQHGSDLVRTAPLGQGAVLRVELSRPADPPALEAIERASRALRAAARRWDGTLPELHASAPAESSDERVLDRMRAFLAAFCGSAGAEVALVVHKGQVVASSRPLTELEAERVPFLDKRAASAARQRRGSSHEQISGDDFFAATFYYDSVLIAFTSAPPPMDFYRLHAKRVARELVHLLQLLDKGPPDPAHINPV